jgi:hypothetical protein
MRRWWPPGIFLTLDPGWKSADPGYSGIIIPDHLHWNQVIDSYLLVKVLESLAKEDEEVVATWYLFDPGSGMEKFGSGIIIPDQQHLTQMIVLYLFLKVLESLAEEDEEVVATWYLLGWMNFLR